MKCPRCGDYKFYRGGNHLVQCDKCTAELGYMVLMESFRGQGHARKRLPPETARKRNTMGVKKRRRERGYATPWTIEHIQAELEITDRLYRTGVGTHGNGKA